MLCSCRTRLQQAPLTTTLPGLVGSLLRWAWGWQGHSLANSPAVVIYWVPYATFCPPSCFSPAHLGTDVFPHLTPSSLIKLLDAYCWSSQEQGGWDSAMAGDREERAFIELSLLLGLWQVIFHLAIYNKEPFFEFYMLQCSCLENSIFINFIAFIGHTKG